MRLYLCTLNCIARLISGAASLMLFVTVLVVFVEPFRTDESFHIYISRLGIVEAGPQDALTSLLSIWFSLVKDDLWSIALLRGLTLLVYFLSALMIYFSIATLKESLSKVYSWSISLAIASWMAVNRGFEIRPEFLAHLCLLFALALVVTQRKRLGSYSLLALISALLFAATLFSFRYWILAFALYFSFVGVGSRLGKLPKLSFPEVCLLSCGFILLTFLLHVAFFDLTTRLASAYAWTASNDIQLGILHKLSFDIRGSALPIFCSLWVIVIIAIYKGTLNSARRHDFTGLLFAVAPIIAYYSFLLLLDSKPFRYTRSTEAVILVCSAVVGTRLRLFISPNAANCHRPVWAGLAFVAVFVAALSDFEGRFRFVTTSLEGDWRSLDLNGMLDQMSSPDGLANQIGSRHRFCTEFASIGVLISSPQSHPYCGVDLGSYYNSGFSKFSDEVRFSRLNGYPTRVLISKSLLNRVTEHGYTCTPVGGYYAICDSSRAPAR